MTKLVPGANDFAILQPLQWNTRYEVEITARNVKGLSEPTFYQFFMPQEPDITGKSMLSRSAYYSSFDSPFFPFLPNFISYFLFFLSLWEYCVIVQATGRKFSSVVTTVSLSDVPVKINAALRRCTTHSHCVKKWGSCVWRNWHLGFYCLEFHHRQMTCRSWRQIKSCLALVVLKSWMWVQGKKYH